VEATVSIEPTLSPEAAGRRLWDVAVIGAGPAGSLAARELARRGAAVLLIDRNKFPRYKVCGGCLNPRAIHQLEKAGLSNLTRDLGAVPLTKLRLGARGQFADVPLPTGAGVSREAFDSALVRAAVAAGAQFLPNTSASSLPIDNGADYRTVRLRHAGCNNVIDARIVLSAGGLGSHLEESATVNREEAAGQSWAPNSRVGAGTMVQSPNSNYEPGVIYMACSEEGYVGQTFVEDGRMDIAAALDPLAVKSAGGIGELATIILKRAGFPSYPNLPGLSWRGTPHLTRQAPRLGGERLFVLGDAAGYIEPFTGEGMAWALAGAGLAAPLVLRGVRNGWDPELLVRWRGAYHRKVTRRQSICRITADLLRRPIATRVMVRSLSFAPWLSVPLFRIMYRD
jgi:flavin-dependent dehydrogenase